MPIPDYDYPSLYDDEDYNEIEELDPDRFWDSRE